jgi:hypothetical protein
MAERMSGLFPPSLVSTDDTKTTTEPLFFVSAEGGMGHLARSAAVILARFVPRHAARQGLGRYTACEDASHEVDHGWVAFLGDAACLDQPHVWRVAGRGAGRLAETYPRVRCIVTYPESPWTFR